MYVRLSTGLLFFFAGIAFPQSSQQLISPQSLRLTVPPGTPLRLYLVKRIPKRLGAPVDARLIAPVFAFDQQVIPAGAEVTGHVCRIESVSKAVRTRAILGGDFTPLHIAEVEFTSVQLPGGKQLRLHTVATPGLNSLYSLKPPKQKPAPPANAPSGAFSSAKQMVKNQINSGLETVKSIPDMVHSPNKMEMVSDYLWSRLPYHPQYVRTRTRFDAELSTGLDFGSESAASSSLALLGSQPVTASVVHARLVTPLNSKTSTAGEPVQAVMTEPLFSTQHQLILPEGTRLAGKVVVTKKAGWFHHGGRLRFTFQTVELSPETLALTAEHAQFRTQASLHGAESSGGAIKVNDEGGVQAQESKTRFIGTALAALVSHAAADNDRVRGPNGTVGGPNPNIGGRTLGGGMGFGLLGSIAAQSSRTVGSAFGYYGLAWSVYSTVVARGKEVEFDKNAMIDVSFNARDNKSSAPPK
jgi:hypothetical protein